MIVIDIDFDKFAHASAKGIALARWRLQVISPALAHQKWSPERAKAVEALAAQKLAFPSGRTSTVTTVTVYRWIKLYETRGLAGLIWEPRSDRGALRAHVNREWDKFFVSRIPHTMVECIGEELDETIRDLWETEGLGWLKVCRKSTEWLFHRTIGLQDEAFVALPLGSPGDGSRCKSQYGLCRVNRRRAERDR